MYVRPKLDYFVLDLSRKMIDYIQSEYNALDFAVKIRCDYSTNRKCSWGGIRRGKNFISLALNKYSLASHYNDPMTFNEYPSFASDPIIGTISGNWQKALAALIAHEMAHAVELGSIKQNAVSAHGLNVRGKHGPLWKEIYRKLRINFVNNANFDDIVSSILPVKLPIVQKRIIKKSWTSKSIRIHRGTITHYFIDDMQIGSIFRSDNAGILYNFKNNSWVKLATTSLCSARKLCFNI